MYPLKKIALYAGLFLNNLTFLNYLIFSISYDIYLKQREPFQALKIFSDITTDHQSQWQDRLIQFFHSYHAHVMLDLSNRQNQQWR